jgi:hypothetical protein
MDFRTEAASATLSAIDDGSAPALAASMESGCVFMAGGRRAHTLIDLTIILLSTSGLIGTFVVLFLSVTGRLPHNTVGLILLGTLVFSLLMKSLKSALLGAYLRARPDGFPRHFAHLPHRNCGLEDGTTYHKIKLVPEDSGICFFDEQRRLILMEGCEYRYIIRAKDVSLVEPISGYGLSGARLICRMRQQQLNFILKAAGQGPMASLIQVFSPSDDAVGLATQLNRTLFGADVKSFTQTVLPPPLPKTEVLQEGEE